MLVGSILCPSSSVGWHTLGRSCGCFFLPRSGNKHTPTYREPCMPGTTGHAAGHVDGFQVVVLYMPACSSLSILAAPLNSDKEISDLTFKRKREEFSFFCFTGLRIFSSPSYSNCHAPSFPFPSSAPSVFLTRHT